MGSFGMTLVCRMNQKKKWWGGSRNGRSSPSTREKQHLIQYDPLLQEAIFNVILFYKRRSFLPSCACFQSWPSCHPTSNACPGVQATSPLTDGVYFPPFQSGLVPCSDSSKMPEVNFEPRPSISSLSVLPLQTLLLGTQARIVRTSVQGQAEAHVEGNWGPWSTDLTQLPAKSRRPQPAKGTIPHHPFLRSPQRTAVSATLLGAELPSWVHSTYRTLRDSSLDAILSH